MWLPCTGKLFVDARKIAKVNLNQDFGDYYLWLLRRKLSKGFRYRYRDFNETADPSGNKGIKYINLLKPFHVPHVTVIKLGFRDTIGADLGALKPLAGERVDIKYNPFIKIGGQRSDFWNFYLLVKSQRINELRQIAGIKPYNRLHITFANTKHDEGERKPTISF